MRRDLHMMEKFCYLGEQDRRNAQAPQLEAVRRKRKQIFCFSSFDYSLTSIATEAAVVPAFIGKPEIGGSEDCPI
jgi:hypothetical protein